MPDWRFDHVDLPTFGVSHKSAKQPAAVVLNMKFSRSLLVVTGVLNSIGSTLSQVTTTELFINEFHYRNQYTDRNEFVEVAVVNSAESPEEMAVGGLSLYDGSTGSTYRNVTVSEASSIVNDGIVTYVVWDIVGILDSPPNGMALYDANGVVVEFISYGGGSFMAVDGVAQGRISKDIGYAESESNDNANSLQRIGIGADDSVNGGIWVVAKQTRGQPNIFQSFTGCDPVADKEGIQLNEIHYDDLYSDQGEFVEFMFQVNAGISSTTIGGIVFYSGATGKSTFAMSVSDATVSYDSDDPNIGYIVWDVALGDGPDGFAIVDKCNTVLQYPSYEGSLLATEGLAKDLISDDIQYSQSGNTADGYSLQRIGIGFEQSRSDKNWVLSKQTRGQPNTLQTFGECNSVANPSAIQINEIHYDDQYSDQDEYVEYVFSQNGGVSPSFIGGLVLYGSSGRSIQAFSLAEGLLKFDGDDADIGYIVWSTGLQDNGPAGFALVDQCNQVIQFDSYEGSLQATEGVAKNSVSKDSGYSQSGQSSELYSLQRIGIGFDDTREHNSWVLALKTKAESNRFQTFGVCSIIINRNSIQLNEVHYDNLYSDRDEFLEFAFLADDVSASNIAGIIIYIDGRSSFASDIQSAVLHFDDDDSGIGFAVWTVSLSDSAAAIALVDGCNNVVQFVSYGGESSATEGLADGLVSVDIGYTEPGTTPVGQSLQRQSCNSESSSPLWIVTANTSGERNGEQDVRSCLLNDGSPTAPAPLPVAPQPIPTMPVTTPTSVSTPVLPVAMPTSVSTPVLPVAMPVAIPTVPASPKIVDTNNGGPVVIPPPLDNVETVVVLVVPENGEVVVNQDGSVSFEPDDDFSGNDSFSAEYCTALGSCTVQTYVVNIANNQTIEKSSSNAGWAALAIVPVIAIAIGYVFWKKKHTSKSKDGEQAGNMPPDEFAVAQLEGDPSSVISSTININNIPFAHAEKKAPDYKDQVRRDVDVQEAVEAVPVNP